MCSGRQVSVTNSFATIKPSAAARWDWDRNDCGPEDVINGSNKKFWFYSSEGPVQWPLHKFKREDGKYGRAPPVPLSIAWPDVAAQWHRTRNGDVTPADIASQTHKKYWWWCDAGPDHEWEASPSVRVGCPYCANQKVSVTNSLATMAPDVAAQWHPTKNGDLTPADVVSRTYRKFWWKCDVGSDHVWEATPSDRVGNGTGCPCCSGHKASVTNRQSIGVYAILLMASEMQRH
jgi:Zn finger protein HypA/HybF involved in hydrogenase expression